MKKSVHLPSHIKPIKYDLTLKPDLEAFVFSGQEIIDIVVEKETKQITLHAKDIDIETVRISSKQKVVGSKEIKVLPFGEDLGEIQFAHKINYNLKNETATFYFKKSIPSGKNKISIIFSGIINDNLRGFYKSKYEIDGKTKYLATTQFEATDARRAFPCFDEPAHKAIFNVKLIVPGIHTAISNTLPINIKEHSTGYKIISFEETPKMSTYLLAFIIGEFEHIEKKVKLSNKNILVRVFTTAGKKHQAKFALDIAIKSIKFYNKYFNIPYPLPTLDLIAIPDFESAAMENWGAITFRESALLVDEEHTSLSNKQWIAIVIAHELAHQWFGNLVTMHWWTDLWLNEGFASYMENICIDYLFPDWKIWELNLAGRYDLALRLDSLENSHPVEIKVHHPDEINEVFDMISYSKGSAIIRMLAEYLGDKKFRDGLRYYLKKNSYKNTKTVDLWNSFEKISNKKIKKMMNSWTKQAGYPLITISPEQDISSHRQGLWLSQERFFSSRISKKNNKTKKLWHVPIYYGDKKLLLTNTSSLIKDKYIGKLNEGEKSFIRIKYDEKILNKIKTQMMENKLKNTDRLGIIRDLFALAEGGYISTTVVLNFLLIYKNETDYIVWSEITSGINRIYHLIKDEPFKEKYKKYALTLFNPLIKKMDWIKKQNEKHSDVFLRSLAISQAGFYGNKEVIKKAQNIFKKRKKIKIEKDYRSAIYSIVAQNGKIKEWKQFKELYTNEQMHEEKERYGYALTRFKNKNLLKKTLKFIFSNSVRNQDAPQLISYVWQNEYGRDLTWKFIKNNWKIILKRYGEGGHFLSKILNPLGNHFKNKDVIDAKKFFAKNYAPGADRALKQVYEKIYSNAAWLKADKKDIRNWLNKNYPTHK